MTETRQPPAARAGFGPAAFARFAAASAARRPRSLATPWPEALFVVFSGAGLGLGWSAGLAQVFGAGEAVAPVAAFASALLLALATASLAKPLPEGERFPRLGANLDAPRSWAVLSVWMAGVLAVADALFLLVFPSASHFFQAVLGLQMLQLCPAAIVAGAEIFRREPRPRWKSPYLMPFRLLSALGTGSLWFAFLAILAGGPAGREAPVFLALAFLFLAARLYPGREHLRFLARRRDGASRRLASGPEALWLLAAILLGAAVPLALVLSALLFGGPFRVVSLAAPFATAVAAVIEAVLFYRVEDAAPAGAPV